MNQFEKKFFTKYIPEGQEIRGVIHEHFIVVIDTVIAWLGLGLFVPAFLYYQSEKIQETLPFVYLELFFFIVFWKIIYEVFNWYFDVFLITEDGVVNFRWSFLKNSMQTVNYENIEGVEVQQHGLWDKIWKKGDIVIHKFGEDSFRLKNAAIPYSAIDEIESFLNNKEEKEDRFELVLRTLSGVLEDYLERNNLQENKYFEKKDDHIETMSRYEKQRYLEKMKESENTIDVRQ